MFKTTFGIVAVIAVFALAGTVTLNVMATGGDGTGGRAAGLFRHLHATLGHYLHGGDHDAGPMDALIEQLNLTPDQLQRLERVYRILDAQGGADPESMAALHERLMAQFEQGHLETDEIHRAIDAHVEQVRVTAYAVTDELVGLVNGLDDTQRRTLLAHLQEHRSERHGHGH